MLLTILSFSLAAATCAFGQSFQRITGVGVEISGGPHGFAVPDTRYAGQEKQKALTRGGSIGVAAGNKLLLTRLRAGIYQSTDFTRLSFRVLESEALVNIYPLEFLRTRKNVLDIYITTGIKFNNLKLNNDNTRLEIELHPDFKSINIRKDRQHVFSQLAGVGMEFVLPCKSKFANLFIEALISNPIATSVNFSKFFDTWSQGETCLNLGLRFGSFQKK